MLTRLADHRQAVAAITRLVCITLVSTMAPGRSKAFDLTSFDKVSDLGLIAFFTLNGEAILRNEPKNITAKLNVRGMPILLELRGVGYS